MGGDDSLSLTEVTRTAVIVGPSFAPLAALLVDSSETSPPRSALTVTVLPDMSLSRRSKVSSEFERIPSISPLRRTMISPPMRSNSSIR